MLNEQKYRKRQTQEQKILSLESFDLYCVLITAESRAKIWPVKELSLLYCCSHCLLGFCVWSLFCSAADLNVLSRFAIISVRERERERERELAVSL